MKILLKEDIKSIPEEDFPLMVLSSDAVSFLSFGVRAVKETNYSHFMWAHRPRYFASQHLWFKEVLIENFCTATGTLKFWAIDGLSVEGKKLIIDRINEELKKPKWKTRYDLLAIVGQLIGIRKLQTPWTKICSEHANYLSLVDPRFPQSTLAPSEVNEWLKKHIGYSVYGKYYPEE